jgi:rhodanese-related sulfurtransferase
MPSPLPEPDQSPEHPANRAVLEITLQSAIELTQLGLATMIDIRQAFELDLKGRIPGTVHIPMIETKKMLGDSLTEDEQDTLDAGRPTDLQVREFFTTINRIHHAGEKLLLCVCNSGRRSLHAAQLLRSLGYGKALSVGGGFQAWKKLPAEQQGPINAPRPQPRAGAETDKP